MPLNNSLKDDGVEFIDADEYIPQFRGVKTYESIVLNQIQVCVNEGSKEMIGGYMQETFTRHGLKEKYIEDQRQKWIESINRLFDLELAFFDKEMDEANNTFKNSLKELNEVINKRLKKQIDLVDDVRIKAAIQSQIEDGYLDGSSFEAKFQIDEKLKIYRHLFQCLLLLYQRAKNQMKEEVEIKDDD